MGLMQEGGHLGEMARLAKDFGQHRVCPDLELVRSRVGRLQRLHTQNGCLPSLSAAACLLLSGQHKPTWPSADLSSHPPSPASPQGTLPRAHLGTPEGLIP